MRNLRFYCPDLRPGQVPLDPAESHHGIHVLRVKPGDPIEVFDGKGRTARAVVSQVNRKEIIVDVHDIQQTPLLKPTIVLAVSLAKGSRFDTAVEKCTELGADHICAVLFERTVKQGKQEALERYHRLAVSASKQCGRAWLPTLSGPLSLGRTIADLKARYPEALCLFGGLGPDANSFDLFRASDVHKQSVICMIGPEGGFTEQEVDLLKSEGCREVTINPHILRTETAAVAFAALLGTLKR